MLGRFFPDAACITYFAPLWICASPDDLLPDDGVMHNIAKPFAQEFSQRLNMGFLDSVRGDLKKTFGPEDVFHYAYAVFHSPTYRERYVEFLKTDFPRLPLTSDPKLFRTLCRLGGELVGLHLLESPQVDTLITSWTVPGDHVVAKGYPKYKTPAEVAAATQGKSGAGRVYINKDQYFEGVAPEVWGFHVGGYQVCEKWLKDRRGRSLDIDGLTHYQKVVAALAETIRLMAEIDAAIPAWPIS
jgi:hypothetical protein